MFGFSHSSFYLSFVNKCSPELVKVASNESYLFYEVANINTPSKQMPFKIRRAQLSIKIKNSINCIKKFNFNECTQTPFKRTLYSRVPFTQLCARYGGLREQDL